MAYQWRRCIAPLAAGITAVALSACGSSSTVESALTPSRIIAFGDGHSDLGQRGSSYTVNGTGGISNWSEQVARDYGLSLKPSAQGGLSFAQGNARVSAKPDAAGEASTPTLAEQIDAFLAAQQFGQTDLVLVSGGTADIIVQARAALAGQITREAAGQQVRLAGQALTEQVQRLLANGAQHVAIIGSYDLGTSVWARNLQEQAFLRDLTRQFNEGFKVSMHAQGFGNRALYVDFEYYLNNITTGPQYFGIEHIDRPVCTSVDAGAGIGIGAGQVNSALCNSTTLVSPQVERYGFADAIYLTPTVHQQFGSWAYGRIRERW
ncbi:SGNH/GDSL hydrolase family protein [Vandammella animalimorsus]|uniref:GDSL family lipase n=1 Tax=Vandammella animalimorsus TaxID=2029117 RepID=A0A2A2B060_9BURK|nr:SGNH/GDSL hydrolase family protein [Vandammella animalimorsus]PAT43456.1 GDSL family lipase [Vandammella animalimorsus]